MYKRQVATEDIWKTSFYRTQTYLGRRKKRIFNGQADYKGWPPALMWYYNISQTSLAVRQEIENWLWGMSSQIKYGISGSWEFRIVRFQDPGIKQYWSFCTDWLERANDRQSQWPNCQNVRETQLHNLSLIKYLVQLSFLLLVHFLRVASLFWKQITISFSLGPSYGWAESISWNGVCVSKDI